VCNATGACTHPANPCGNGQVDAGETCDEGNYDPTDCCLATCQVVAPNAPCADDGNPGTVDRCNGLVCEHVPPVCGNGVVEVLEQCEVGLGVGGYECCTASCTPKPLGAPCAGTDPDVMDVCPGAHANCTAGSCPASPPADCLASTAARLKIVKRASGDRIAWKLTKRDLANPATFATPTSTTGYMLCVYDASARVVAAFARPGGVCGGKPCWAPSSGGFSYRNTAASDGISSLGLSARTGSGTRISALGKGAALDLPAQLSTVAPLAAVLTPFDTTGVMYPCWKSTFASVQSSPSAVKARQ
jgi:hypothetical protein